MDTGNTLPLETLNAYRDHGQSVLRIEQSMADADGVMGQLAGLGMDVPALDRLRQAR